MAKTIESQSFRTLSAFVAALAVGACSPLAPSVSKLSNAAGQKTSPTDGASPTSNVSVPGGFRSSKSGSATEGSPQQTEVSTLGKFKKTWGIIRDSKPAMQLGVKAVGDFMTKGGVEFSAATDRIKGNEAALIRSNTRIYLVVDTDPATIAEHKLAEVKADLTWHPATADSEGRFELSIKEPDTTVADPATATEAEKIQNRLREHLVGVAIEFQAE